MKHGAMILSMDKEQSVYQWMKEEVRKYVPHQMAICGLAKPSTLGISIMHAETIDTPSNYIEQASRLFPVGCPILSRWLLIRKPQFVEFGKTKDQGMDMLFDVLNVKNLFLHGYVDPHGGYISFFCFYQMDVPLAEVCHDEADQLAEVIHRGLVKQHSISATLHKSKHKLTNAEYEVYKWLKLGKTNWEIGIILGKSQWTVKTQVQHILRKLNVNSRHELREMKDASLGDIMHRPLEGREQVIST